jgi:hypothetical protein
VWARARQLSQVELEYLKTHSSCPVNQLCIALSNTKNQIRITLAGLDGKTPAKKVLAGNKSFRSKIGKRPDLNNQFFRSGWEANFYRYLKHTSLHNTLIQYEPMDFTFTIFGIVKGPAVSYTPDFKVTYTDEHGKETYKWIEIKGFLKPADKTKLRRFKKYFAAEFARLEAVVGSKNVASAKFFTELIKHIN